MRVRSSPVSIEAPFELLAVLATVLLLFGICDATPKSSISYNNAIIVSSTAANREYVVVEVYGWKRRMNGWLQTPVSVIRQRSKQEFRGPPLAHTATLPKNDSCYDTSTVHYGAGNGAPNSPTSYVYEASR